MTHQELLAEVASVRLSRDLLREQLSATIAERDAERSLSDALAEALRAIASRDGAWTVVTAKEWAVLDRHGRAK